MVVVWSIGSLGLRTAAEPGLAEPYWLRLNDWRNCWFVPEPVFGRFFCPVAKLAPSSSSTLVSCFEGVARFDPFFSFYALSF